MAHTKAPLRLINRRPYIYSERARYIMQLLHGKQVTSGDIVIYFRAQRLYIPHPSRRNIRIYILYIVYTAYIYDNDGTVRSCNISEKEPKHALRI